MKLSLEFNERLAKSLGAKLKAARKRAGLTADDVAQGLGSHRPIVSRTESGRHLPELEQLVRHACAVGVTLREIGETVDEELERERRSR